MGFLHAKTNLSRISRIPARIGHDLKTLMIAKNWREILAARLSGKPLKSILLRNGAQLESPPEVDLLFLFNEIWMDGIYDFPGYEIRPGSTVIDIGGNIGSFAVFAAKRAPEVKIYSYEPFPRNAEYLRRNITASGLDNVTVIEKAVAGNSAGRFLRIDDSWVKHSLAQNGAGDSGLRVDCISLDEIMLDLKHCDLLKIDCEGGEYEIFYRAKPETLSAIDRVICEYHDGEQGTGRELKDFFEARSFKTDIFRSFDDTTGLICARNIK